MSAAREAAGGSRDTKLSHDKCYVVKWKGQEYVWIFGAIATREQYENFQVSTAHCFEDGHILQYGQQVGTIDEVEYVRDLADNE